MILRCFTGQEKTTCYLSKISVTTGCFQNSSPKIAVGTVFGIRHNSDIRDRRLVVKRCVVVKLKLRGATLVARFVYYWVAPLLSNSVSGISF